MTEEQIALEVEKNLKTKLQLVGRIGDEESGVSVGLENGIRIVQMLEYSRYGNIPVCYKASFEDVVVYLVRSYEV